MTGIDHSELNLFLPEFRRDPYPCYRQLRRHAPVHYFPDENLWAVTRCIDAVEILRQPHLFSSVLDDTANDPTLLGADPPSHTRIRKLLAGPFSANVISAMETRIRGLVDNLVDRMAAKGEFDFMTEFARPLPLLVVAEMLGMDYEECLRVSRWQYDDWLLRNTPHSPPERSRLLQRQQEFDAFSTAYVERCRTRPPEGILDSLLQSGSGGERLTPAEAYYLMRQFVVAGSETTTNLLGNALFALLNHPDQLRLIEQDRTLIPSMIEEALRYDTPVQTIRRRPTQDVVLSGVVVPAEARVVVFLGSVNRDEALFPDGERFLIGRHPTDHIAFGLGPHFCLGARLARLEMRVAFEAIITRLRGLKPAQRLDEVRFIDSYRFRGPEGLNLALDAFPAG